VTDGATRILIVDDEANIREVLRRGLSHAGYECATAETVDAAAKIMQREGFDIVVLDMTMPGRSGMDFLPEINSIYPDVAVLMLTGNADVAAAVKAMQVGAYDYLAKPISLPELVMRIEHAESVRSLRLESIRYQSRLRKMVDKLTTLVDQRQREVEALNELFQSHLREDHAAQDAYSALKESVSSFYTELDELAEDSGISD
jgi:DNA-binding NtrC family response regulator